MNVFIFTAMNKMLYGFVIWILMQGCSLPVKDDDKLLLQKFDSINQHLMELKKQLNEKDSVNVIQLAKADSFINAASRQGKKSLPQPAQVQTQPPTVTPIHLKQPPSHAILHFRQTIPGNNLCLRYENLKRFL